MRVLAIASLFGLFALGCGTTAAKSKTTGADATATADSADSGVKDAGAGSDSSADSSADAGNSGADTGAKGDADKDAGTDAAGNPQADAQADAVAQKPDPTVACGARAQALCSVADSCTSGLASQIAFGDVKTCVKRRTDECIAQVVTPGSNWANGDVDKCAEGLKSWSCAALIQGQFPPACKPPAGSRKDDEACSLAVQCQSTWCHIGAHSAEGKCGPVPKPGDACGDTACDPSQRCATGSDGKSVCIVPVAVDGVCDSALLSCDKGLTCVGQIAGKQGKCAEQGKVAGDICDPKRIVAADCSRARGLYCDTTHHCKQADYVHPGSVCEDTASVTLAWCDSAALCIQAAGKTSGSCLAPAPDGGTCSPNAAIGPGCMIPARCVVTLAGSATGTCTLPQ